MSTIEYTKEEEEKINNKILSVIDEIRDKEEELGNNEKQQLVDDIKNKFKDNLKNASDSATNGISQLITSGANFYAKVVAASMEIMKPNLIKIRDIKKEINGEEIPIIGAAIQATNANMGSLSTQLPPPPLPPTIQPIQKGQNGGGAQISTRVKKSMNEFLNSSITSSYILNNIHRKLKVKSRQKRRTGYKYSRKIKRVRRSLK